MIGRMLDLSNAWQVRPHIIWRSDIMARVIDYSEPERVVSLDGSRISNVWDLKVD